MPTKSRARVLALVTVSTIAVLVTGCGGGTSSPTAAGRTIDINMTDNAFQPNQLSVAKGETVKLRFKNNGTVKHEAIIGDDAAQAKHHEEMSASTAPNGGGMNMEHGNMKETLVVEPGKSGELTHTFNEQKSILLACHEPGHWEAGMKANIIIT